LTPRSRPCRKREPARFWSAPKRFFVTRLEQVVALAARYAVPAIYSNSQFTAAGGLMTYGGNIIEGYRQAGVLAQNSELSRKAGDFGATAVPSQA
jgi:hypothetical protein